MSVHTVRQAPIPAARPRPRGWRRRAFSAVELIAVATIIVILSMILVQSLRKRVEDARVAAAKHEMGELGDVISLAFAETNRFFRLQDYDNSTEYNENVVDMTIEVPLAYYDEVGGAPGIKQPLSNFERKGLSARWNGPYTAFRNYIEFGDLVADPPRATILSEVWGGTGDDATALSSLSGGPVIWGNRGGQLETLDRYPLDPWGNPYIFESSYRGAFLYSMGQDGVPGPDPADLPLPNNYPQPENYWGYDPNPNPPTGARRDGKAGHPESDDIEYPVQ